MQYISHYSSPLGEMLLAADKAGLTGLWFEGRNILRVHWNKSIWNRKYRF